MTKPAESFGDPEINAMAVLASALDPLTEGARLRVLAWARGRYAPQAVANTVSVGRIDQHAPAEIVYSQRRPQDFATLGDLIAQTGADSDDQRALAAAIFIGQKKGDETFTAAEVNSELKHVGHPVQNITRVLQVLIDQRPALAVQLRKSGTTRQARKTYKVTEAGLRTLQRLLGGAD